MSCAVTWMDLEIVNSEVTDREEISYDIPYIRIQKEMIQMNFTKQKQTHKLKEKFMVASGVKMG